MDIGQYVALLGILVTTSGTVLLVAGAVQIPSLLGIPEFQRGHRKRIEESHAARTRGHENYSEERRAAAFEHADIARVEDHEKLDKLTAQQWWDDRQTLVRRSFWGVLFIGVGTVGQGVAVLLIS